MTDSYNQRSINLQPGQGQSFYLFAPNGSVEDGMTFSNWENLLNALATVPGKKVILIDPGVAGGTAVIPVRTGEVTSTYNLTDIELVGARPNTFVDVSNVQLDFLEFATNIRFINPTSTIPTFVVATGATRVFQFDGCTFAQSGAGATDTMFNIDGAGFINSINCDYFADPGSLDLFDVDAAGGLTILSIGSNKFGSNPLTSIFGGATPASLQVNADDTYFAGVQTTPALVTLISNLDVSLGGTPSTAAWGGPGVPVNITDAINRMALFIDSIHGVIP